MHILLLSTVISESRFNELVKNGCASNPSNQHFYHSLAKMLAINYQIDILVNRPFVKKKELRIKEECETEDRLNFHYLSYFNIPKFKSVSIAYYSLKRIKQLIHKDTIIFVDSLNYSLIKLGFRIAKKFKLPIVGVITDHPKNLTNAPKRYLKMILRYWPRYDYYYCLTEALNKASNPYNHPSFIKEGLIDPDYFKVKQPRPLEQEYMFFGGALYERYGVLDLLKAFHSSSLNTYLVIAGHGPLKSTIEQFAKIDNRIHYVGLLSWPEMIAYEQNAICNINPRPINEIVDALSFPSKVLEYLTSGVPLLTTNNQYIKRIFNDNVFWIDLSTEQGFIHAFEKFFALSNDGKKKRADTAYKLASTRYFLT